MNYSYTVFGGCETVAEDGEATAYTANVLNQYTTVNDTLLSYDQDGNLLTDGEWSFTWNDENRLQAAVNGSTRLEFAYDYMGRRVEKKVFDGETVIKHHRYVYDGYKLIAVYDELNNNSMVMTFIWQPIGLDVPLCMTVNGETYYFVTDGNKNVTGLFNVNGERVASYTYGPFGQVLSATGDMALVNPFRFSSEFHDDETGLVYYNYRYYSPKLGRWTRRDPIGENGGMNLYGFAQNTAVNYYDHLGRKTPEKSPYKVCCRGTKDTDLIKHCELAYGDCGKTYDEQYETFIRRVGQMDNGKCCSDVTIGDIIECAGIALAGDRNESREEFLQRTEEISMQLEKKRFNFTGRNPYSAGNSTVGDNCQSNTVGRLAKCCLSSTWEPAWYAGNPRGKCIRYSSVPTYIIGVGGGMGISFVKVCVEYEYDRNLK